MGGMESNKLFASILLAGLIAMLSGFIAEKVYDAKLPEETPIFVDTAAFETAAAGGVVEEPKIEPVVPLLASADPDRGARLVRACTACHTFEKGGPTRAVGPNQWGVVGDHFAHAADFAYSDALLARKDEYWTYEALNLFLTRPGDFIPGTKMNYAGMRKVEDRADLIAWLRLQDDDPEPLPTQAEIDAAIAEFEGTDDAAAPAEEGESAE